MQLPPTDPKSINLHLLGVYGTLKHTGSNHKYLEHALYVKDARIPGIMVDYGFCPAAVLAQHVPVHHAAYDFVSNRSILIELYEINQYQLDAIDKLEGHPNYYKRTMVPVGSMGHAWVYNVPWEWVLAGDQEVVTNGDWKDHGSLMKVDFGKGDSKPKIFIPTGGLEVNTKLEQGIKEYASSMQAKQDAEAKKTTAYVGGESYAGPDPWEDDYWHGTYSPYPYSSRTSHVQQEIVRYTPAKQPKEA